MDDAPASSSPKQFLSVPQARSRATSWDSEGETYAPSTSQPSHSDRSTNKILDDEHALKPDPGTEDDFNIENNAFAFSPGQLSKLLNPKSLAAFHALGGPVGLEKGLRTNLKSGLSVDETNLSGTVSFDEAISSAQRLSPSKAIPHEPNPLLDNPPATTTTSDKSSAHADRRRVFKDNRLPERDTKNIFQLMWMAYNDKVLILLTIAAIISLALGIYQTVGQPHEDGEAHVEWVEGVAIMVAIVIVVVVGAVNDWQKERQFVKLNKKKEDRFVKAVRSGKVQEISVYDILTGDIVLLEPGDVIPVDGIFLEGHNLKCDESSATGESDILKKSPADEVYTALENGISTKKMDPFILSGAKVNEGVGRFIVTATGVHSTYGKTMMSLRDEGEVTPLQSKLNVLATQIAKMGGAAALLYFIVAFLEFIVRITAGSLKHESPAQKGQGFLNIFILAVSIVVVAVPEGLPLAVTLALAFATTRMLKDNNLVRLLRSCETMGNATTVCSDKTGTLTQNKMTIVAGTLGTSSRFGDHHGENHKQTKSVNVTTTATDDVSPREVVSTLSADVKTLLLQSIALNSTAFEGFEDGVAAFVGSKTETALLTFAREHLGMGEVAVERANAEVKQFMPFDSGRKCMAVVVKISESKYRLLVKGASELMLQRCSSIIADPIRSVSPVSINSDTVDALQNIISTYASRSLRTIGLLYRDFESWPPRGMRRQEDDPSQINFEDLLRDMTFLGVVGIQDPLRPGVPEAVNDCRRAGVVVRMVTGDNVETARAIAKECGILTEDGIVMEGPEFRKLSDRAMGEMLPRLQVLARSSPEDKRKLVKRLKEMGETVAVTGDGTNDAPALKAADVGFSMGISGTEVAKEASAIILMDDNFSSIVKALLWGRAVNDAVKKFLQFQLTVNITAVLITFITGVANQSGESVLTAVQLLWVNLIMDTFAALALATDPPSQSMLDRKPDKKSAPLITITMWKQILGQAIFQLVVILVLYFKGQSIFDYDDNQRAQLQTMIFNIFVWMQIANAFNNRRLDNRFNIFEGIHRNLLFIGIIGIMIGGQILIVFVGGAALSTTPLTGSEWGYSILFGCLTFPVGVIIRLVPDEFIRAIIPNWMIRKSAPTVVVDDIEQGRFEWNPAITEIRDELLFLKKFKGGRLNNLKFKMKHPRELLPPRPSSSRSRSSTHTSVNPPSPVTPSGTMDDTKLRPPMMAPLTPPSTSHSRIGRGRVRSNSAFGPAAAMAGIVAGSIAGWSPMERPAGEAGEGFPGFVSPGDRARSKSDLTPGGGRVAKK